MNSLNLTEGKILQPPCLDNTCKGQSPQLRRAVESFWVWSLGSSTRTSPLLQPQSESWAGGNLSWPVMLLWAGMESRDRSLSFVWGWRAGLGEWEGLSWSIRAQEGYLKISPGDLSRQRLPRLYPSGTDSVIRSRMSFAVVIWTWACGCKSPLCVLSCSF